MNAITETKIERIRSLSIELDAIGKTALEKASEAGRLLSECKDGLKHGEWLPWLESNFTFTDRTARRWMKLDEDIRSGKIKSDSVSNLAEAYRITTETKVVSGCPFKMPSANERLLMRSVNGDCAVVEPMGEDYVQITFTEPGLDDDGLDLRIANIAGTKRGIHKDHAWKFLRHLSQSDWSSAVISYGPYKAPDIAFGTQNKKLSTDQFDWIADCLEIPQGGIAS